ncbi:MAG: hypothetical protein Q9163_001417 [Psora crenata]
MESAEDASPPASSRDTFPGANEVSKANFAFLVDTQSSLGQHTGPSIDNQRLARQKRRRTSPEDHAILEAEYERNPKPDKLARQEIVKRVALGEKEVQIWFQNRRQMTRRKSKPFLNQDVDLSLLSSQEHFQNTRFSSFAAYSDSQQPSVSSQSSTTASQPLNGPEIIMNDKPRVIRSISVTRGSTDSGDIDNKSDEGNHQPFVGQNRDGMRPWEPTEPFNSVSQSIVGKQRPGYIANRRSAPFIIHDDKNPAVASKTVDMPRGTETPNGNGTARSSISLRRTTSLVKLSMDSEGKAEVMPRTGDTPSPPHSRPSIFTQSAPRPPLGLQRSISAIESGGNAKSLGSFSGSSEQRKAIVKSRDARTWEFYCDSDARNALTEQAERIERGSATAAIGLLRSYSHSNKTLTTNSNKRNSHVQKQESVKRYKASDDKPSKPKLGRATSSFAQLQTTHANNQKQKARKAAVKHRKSSSQSSVFEDFDGDSDKENWEPGTQSRRPHLRRPATSQESARILLESLREPSQSSSLGAVLSQGTKEGKDKGNEGPETDDEVAAFMGETALPREEEDLDCVQNLLSLSQAIWE